MVVGDRQITPTDIMGELEPDNLNIEVLFRALDYEEVGVKKLACIALGTPNRQDKRKRSKFHLG